MFFLLSERAICNGKTKRNAVINRIRHDGTDIFSYDFENDVKTISKSYEQFDTDFEWFGQRTIFDFLVFRKNGKVAKSKDAIAKRSEIVIENEKQKAKSAGTVFTDIVNRSQTLIKFKYHIA